MHRLWPVRERVPRRRDWHRRWQGEAFARRFLRWHGRLPALVSDRRHHVCRTRAQMLHAPEKTQASPEAEAQSQLAQWPCQIKLMPLQSPYYQGADLLIAADCTAFSYASFHDRYMRGRVTIIGCPKLDAVDYTEKLSAIIAMNDIRSVTVCRMEVPCCGGLQRAAENALAASGKKLPFEVVTFSVRGEVL